MNQPTLPGATLYVSWLLAMAQITVAVNAALAAARRPQRDLAATLGRDDAYAG